MLALVFVKLRFSGPTPDMMKKAHNEVTRVGYRAMGVYWHKVFRPKHFTRAGATEYDYEPREGERGKPGSRGFKRSYTGRKLQAPPEGKGHTLPLVFTGDSMFLSRIQDVRVTATGGTTNRRGRARVVMRTPTLNFRPEGRTDTMGEELTRVTDKEATQIARIGAKAMGAKYRTIRAQRTVTL